MLQIIAGNIIAVTGIVTTMYFLITAIPYRNTNAIRQIYLYTSIPVIIALLGIIMIYYKTNIFIAIGLPILTIMSLSIK